MSGTYESIDANPSDKQERADRGGRRSPVRAEGARRDEGAEPDQGDHEPRSRRPPADAADRPSTPVKEHRGADHQDERAGDRRRCRVGVCVVAQHRVDHQHRQHQERDGHHERPSPADRVRQQTADRWAEQPRQQPGGGHQRQHPWPDRRRERLGDGPQRQRVRGPAGRTLHEPPDQSTPSRRSAENSSPTKRAPRRHHEGFAQTGRSPADDRDRADHHQRRRRERPSVQREGSPRSRSTAGMTAATTRMCTAPRVSKSNSPTTSRPSRPRNTSRHGAGSLTCGFHGMRPKRGSPRGGRRLRFPWSTRTSDIWGSWSRGCASAR